jgi:hypothetical protein
LSIPSHARPAAPTRSRTPATVATLPSSSWRPRRPNSRA